MGLQVRIPAEHVTDDAKRRYLYLAREALRRQHNAMGDDLRARRITQAEWEEYVALSFKPRSAAISEAINAQRASMRMSMTALPDDDSGLRAVDLERDFAPNGD